ncbi:MAG: hypothetical protein KF805_12305 [Phycisphaeraceae bacterium]|nr:hypothetical protein [Phycisphaeraceae bacterium]
MSLATLQQRRTTAIASHRKTVAKLVRIAGALRTALRRERSTGALRRLDRSAGKLLIAEARQAAEISKIDLAIALRRWGTDRSDR